MGPRCCSAGQRELLEHSDPWPADRIFHNAHLAVQLDRDPACREQNPWVWLKIERGKPQVLVRVSTYHFFSHSHVGSYRVGTPLLVGLRGSQEENRCRFGFAVRILKRTSRPIKSKLVSTSPETARIDSQEAEFLAPNPCGCSPVKNLLAWRQASGEYR